MRQRAPILILLLVAAATTSGCASGMRSLIDQQNIQIQEMQVRVDQVTQQDEAEAQELEAIRRDISQIGTKVTQSEETLVDLSRKTENVSTRLSLLTEEVTRIKTEPAAPPPEAAPGVVLFGEEPAASSGNTRAIYDNALRLYYDEKPREAIAEFSRMVESAPASDLTDNAEYWVGECYYKLEEFEPALAAFQRVFNHQGSNKYEDAQLKIGMTYRLMDRRTEAIAALRELIQKYPNSQHVELAQRILIEIGG
ncbi:tetratricopeptide repeat protein [Gemmatimonadota bacterium]